MVGRRESCCSPPPDPLLNRGGECGRGNSARGDFKVSANRDIPLFGVAGMLEEAADLAYFLGTQAKFCRTNYAGDLFCAAKPDDGSGDSGVP